MIRTLRFMTGTALGIAIPLAFVSAVSADVRHTVEPGDTLTYLSQVYARTIDDIVELNDIADPDFIRIGDELLITPDDESRGVSDDAAPAASAETHTIEFGETMTSIAARYNVTVGALAEANGIEDPAYIVSGDILTIPGTEVVAYVPPPPLAFPDRPDNPEIEAILEEISYEFGVDPRLVKALATIESGWHQGSVSRAGAVGVMQLMPGTTAWLESEVFKYDLYETDSPYDNIKLGVRYLRLLLDSTEGNERLAVASYYQGLTPTQSGVFYPDTADYVQMIFRVRDAYWP